MRTLEALSHLSRVSDICAFFGIPDDAGVLGEHGGEILALWAREVAAIDALRPPPPEPERLARYASALHRCHEAFALPARCGARGWRVIEGGCGPAARELRREAEASGR
jgi:hypothetical protein